MHLKAWSNPLLKSVNYHNAVLYGRYTLLLGDCHGPIKHIVKLSDSLALAMTITDDKGGMPMPYDSDTSTSNQMLHYRLVAWWHHPITFFERPTTVGQYTNQHLVPFGIGILRFQKSSPICFLPRCWWVYKNKMLRWANWLSHHTFTVKITGSSPVRNTTKLKRVP